MGARGVSNGLLRRMPNKAHHFPPYYIAEQSIVIIGCFAFIRKIRHKHTRDTSVCFYTVWNIFPEKRWFQRSFHGTAPAAAFLSSFCTVYFCFFCSMGISGLRKPGGGPGTMGGRSFCGHTVYWIADLLSAPFRNQNNMPGLWTADFSKSKILPGMRNMY